jgi:serine/threonine protein phosphatase PrpC
MNAIVPRIDVGAASEAARTRSSLVNQDAVAVVSISRSEHSAARVIFVAVADGMGALEAPQEASLIAVQAALSSFLSEGSPFAARAAAVVVEANRRILEHATGRDLGSTLTCLLLDGSMGFIGHIGDCRLFLFRDGNAQCLTVDHSVVAERLGVANPTPDQLRGQTKNLRKSLGERSLGAAEIYTSEFSLRPGDCVVVCSDGVWTDVDAAELLAIARSNSAQKAAESIVKIALDRDPSDDASAIVVTYDATTLEAPSR